MVNQAMIESTAGIGKTDSVSSEEAPPPARLLGRSLPTDLSRRERFLRACYGRPVDCAPVWLMRQAGRCLPEYRKLKETHSFLELVQTPDLAAEVTLQPIRRFDFDAAIIFSDILVVPEALGQGYRFRDTGGVAMEFSLDSEKDIDRLATGAIREKLAYVTDAIRLVKQSLHGKTALLGFAGSPWTLANFMLEGGSSTQYTRAFELHENRPELFDRLFEKLTGAVVEFLRMQIQAGVDAVQIFDSHGGLLLPEYFESASGRWIRQIIAALRDEVPVIVFSKGTHASWEALVQTGARVLGVDWAMPLTEARRHIPAHIGIQGNLDPALLNTATPERVATETARVLCEMQGRQGHIFNLGHGVPPDADLNNIQAVLDTVRNVT
jgi:uroporphyrinogen decarboxylase